jgi:flagellar protein FliL
MTKDTAKTSETPKKKGGKAKTIIIIGLATILLVGGGIGAGLYAAGAGITGKSAPKEDPNRPKLVERNEEPEVAEAGEGGEAKAPAPKEGTISVKSDRQRVDPRKFDATYFPIDQSFTANLADGSGFVQVGLTLATYYDKRVIANINRQLVPIRSAILLVLSDQEAAALSTPQGKQILQRDLTAAVNHVLREHEGFGGIDNIYFTNLVIQ